MMEAKYTFQRIPHSELLTMIGECDMFVQNSNSDSKSDGNLLKKKGRHKNTLSTRRNKVSTQEVSKDMEVMSGSNVSSIQNPKNTFDELSNSVKLQSGNKHLVCPSVKRYSHEAAQLNLAALKQLQSQRIPRREIEDFWIIRNPVKGIPKIYKRKSNRIKTTIFHYNPKQELKTDMTSFSQGKVNDFSS